MLKSRKKPSGRVRKGVWTGGMLQNARHRYRKQREGQPVLRLRIAVLEQRDNLQLADVDGNEAVQTSQRCKSAGHSRLGALHAVVS